MKITKAALKQIIKEELAKVLNEDDGYYEYYLDTPHEGIYMDSVKTLEEAEKEIKHALSSFFAGAQLVAIWGPQGELVKLGDRYDEEAAREIKQENQ
jgi:hypothetical protein